MLIKLPLWRLPEHGRDRPPAFLAAVLAAAHRTGDTLEIASEKWSELSRLHGVLGVPPATFGARDKACLGCDWTRTNGPRRFCDHPDRSCAILSPQRASETCPLNQWPAMPTEQTTSPSRLARQAHEKRRAEHSAAHAEKLDQTIARLEQALSGLKARRATLAPHVVKEKNLKSNAAALR